MIISQKRGAIYVAIPKTASQAVSAALFDAMKEGEGAHPEELMHDWHATLREAQDSSDLPLENFWSFTFVRNPFDRFISYCAGHVESFSDNPALAIQTALEEARAGENRWLRPQSDFTEGVRQVYRYEFMNEAIADIALRLRINVSKVPRINVSERQGYAGYYDDALKAAVSELYTRDLANFDYRF